MCTCKSVCAAYKRCVIGVFKALVSQADAERLYVVRNCWFNESGARLREWAATFGGFSSEEAIAGLELMAAIVLMATSTLAKSSRLAQANTGITWRTNTWGNLRGVVHGVACATVSEKNRHEQHG